MEIIRENKAELNDIIKISISQDDYKDNVNGVLKKYQKTANIPGFRKGMVPFGMIQKMYGKVAKLEEIQKVGVDALNKYIDDNNIKLMGEPIPEALEETAFDLLDDFTFNFEIGIQPEVEVDLAKFDVDRYRIVVEDKILEENIANLQNRFGNYDKFEVANETSMIHGEFVELDKDNNPTERLNSTSIYIEKLDNEEIELKNKLIGLKLGESIEFEASIVKKSNISLWLGIKLVDVDSVNKIKFTAKEIVNITPQEVNVDFFKKVFPEDNIETEEEFRIKLKKINEEEFNKITDQNFVEEVVNKLITDINFNIPLGFLKKWITYTNNGNAEITEDVIEKEMPNLEKTFKSQIIESTILKNNGFSLSNESILVKAKEIMKQRFESYGYFGIDEKIIDEQVGEFLKVEKNHKGIVDMLVNEKLLEIFNNSIKINEKEVTFDEYKNLKK